MVHKYNPCPLLFPAVSDLKVRAHPYHLLEKNWHQLNLSVNRI